MSSKTAAVASASAKRGLRATQSTPTLQTPEFRHRAGNLMTGLRALLDQQVDSQDRAVRAT
jgi:hypothetical protein